MLQRLRERMGRGSVQYLDVERCASTHLNGSSPR